MPLHDRDAYTRGRGKCPSGTKSIVDPSPPWPSDVEMNLGELRRETDGLATDNHNGRQIRNINKSARQLASFRNEKFGYQHLQRVMKVANEFEQYLVKTRGHTDEIWAKEQGTRA